MSYVASLAKEQSQGNAIEHEQQDPWSSLEFRGQAGEYFRIWIINILLSVLTLSIYSAWATVRNRRYFYGNTFLDNSHFDFHGDPKAILVGRLIAIVLLAGYVAGGYLHPVLPAATMLLITVLVPLLIVRSLRFRYRNTSYRNLRFNFVGGVGQAYGIFGLFFAMALLVVAVPGGLGWLAGNEGLAITGVFLGLLLLYVLVYPAFIHSLTTFTASHSSYGTSCFNPTLKREAYIGFFLGSIGVGLAAFMIFGVLLAIFAALFAGIGSGMQPEEIARIAPVLSLIIVPAYFLPYAFWKVKTANYLFNNTQLESVQFRSNLKVMRYWGILLGNAALVVITLGLAIPWAKVRMARYRVESVAYQGDLQGFIGLALQDRGAIGDEIGDAFDIELVGI